MGGELSKESGEIGEHIAKALLRMIGWDNFVQKISIDCNTPTHVNEKGNSRTTHGEDQIFIYHSPFHDDRTDIVHISDKNNIGGYAKGQTLKTQFKDYLKELHEIIECAKYSPKINDLYKSFQAKKNINHSGLIIWIHNNRDDIERNIISDLANTRLDDESDKPIYLIDNSRAAFLLKAIDNLKKIAVGGGFEFFYPRIGTAVSVDASRTGKVLPLELIASDILPALVKKEAKQELIVYANQPFCEVSYGKLIAYALNFATGLVSTIRIGMPNFNPATDQKIADQVRLRFHERNEEISVFSFNRSILDFLQEPTI